MLEPLRYEFEMTPEFARAGIPTVEQALWFQNERLYRHVEARMPFRSALRSVGIMLSVLALLFATVGWATTPGHNVFFAAASTVLAVLLLSFVMLPSISRFLRRFARRTVASTARKLMQPVASRAPYRIIYELNGHSLLTIAPDFSTTLDLGQVQVAVATPKFICAFPSRFAQRPARVLYLPGPKEHTALSAALAASGAEVVNIPAE